MAEKICICVIHTSLLYIQSYTYVLGSSDLQETYRKVSKSNKPIWGYAMGNNIFKKNQIYTKSMNT